MNYKGYIGHAGFDEKANIFHGEVINTKDVITFQGASVSELKKAFVDSVDDYLEFCELRKEAPMPFYIFGFNRNMVVLICMKMILLIRNNL